MYRRARIAAFVGAAAVFLGNAPSAQVMVRPTAPPIVTAENEPWYLSGEPITYAGNLYYPAGPEEFFDPNEMVRSGYFSGVPLYTRTTLEPYSVVYVPLANKQMQPYVRGRTGELAGTSGSRPTAVPVPYQPGVAEAEGPAQAAGPPFVVPHIPPFGPDAVSPGREEPATVIVVPDGAAAVVVPDVRQEVPAPVGTTGDAEAAQRRPTHVRIGGEPQGINAIFVEFQNQRWYSTGETVQIDPARMERVGEHHGFAVWAEPDTRGRVIYMPVTRGGTLAVRYTKTRPRGLFRWP